ncbi:alpha/beta fold hydrolase [Martelella radicis]|uniref:Pimeloyl-ACP methyl ester carboxylesterase n=1 Tax=Martelella radicis TaxID=1397476 RepID=A0A7W6KFH7_9HYPH|nr:alpha/beta hydrolase [Martelella radicis]MBB4120152.1 pimeloyl-ACP methyl ester carboxylesterase [Martelella radicis]
MRSYNRTAMFAVVLIAVVTTTAAKRAEAQSDPYAGIDVSEASLVGELSGFSEGFAKVNGIRLHYVEGGEGTPVVLLPGWPQTWWAYHKIMPALAERYHVIAVDIRGMGASDKPEGGYDKKNMAVDVFELMESLGYEKAHIVGHDIGSQVTYAFAANYPDATLSATFLDVPGLDDAVLGLKLLPEPGGMSEKATPENFFLWWFAFNQVKDLPEDLIAGRAHLYEDWFFNYLMVDQSDMSERDRAVYAHAYNSRDAIRAGNGWYQAFPQDIVDARDYSDLEMPTLGLGGFGYYWIANFLETHAESYQIEQLEGVGHYVMEEAPDAVTGYLLEFLEDAETN